MRGLLQQVALAWLLLAEIRPATSLEITPDLQCSACVITSNVIEDAVVEFMQQLDESVDHGTHQLDVAAWARASCEKLPRVAVAGPEGRREFIDFNKAMRKEHRGSKETALVNVKFTKDVSAALRGFCAAAVQEFTQAYDLATELQVTRTVQDLDVLGRLCFRDFESLTRDSFTAAPTTGLENGGTLVLPSARPHCPLSKKPKEVSVNKRQQKEDRSILGSDRGGDSGAGAADNSIQVAARRTQEEVRRRRKDHFVNTRPYLFGRVPATAAGGFCETCFTLVDEVHDVLFAQVEEARQQVHRGVRREVGFDVVAAVKEVCSTRNPEFSTLSLEIQNFCEMTLQQREDKTLSAFAKHFSGEAPSDSNVFLRKGLICGELRKECRTLEVRYGDVKAVGPGGRSAPAPGALTKCNICSMYVSDVWAGLRRKSRHTSDFLSAGHVERVLENSCNTVRRNFPSHVARQLEHACEDLLLDYDSDLLHVFTSFKDYFFVAVEKQQQQEGDDDDDIEKTTNHPVQYPDMDFGGSAEGGRLTLVDKVCAEMVHSCPRKDRPPVTEEKITASARVEL